MRNMQSKICNENRYFKKKIHSTTSLLNKESLMKSSQMSLKHSDHLSRYGRNMRHFDTLPKIFQKSTMTNVSMTNRDEFNASYSNATKSNLGINNTRSGLNVAKSNDSTKADELIHSNDLTKEETSKFYDKGSILVIVNHIKGDLEKEKCIKIVFLKDNDEEISSYEFLLENNKNVKNNIEKNLIEGLDQIKANIFLVESEGEEPKKIGGVSFNMNEIEESDNGQYTEIIKSELSYGGIKYGVNVLRV